MSLEQALAENTAAINKLCEMLAKQNTIAVEGPYPAETKTPVKTTKGVDKILDAEEIKLPGKSYAEHSAELEAAKTVKAAEPDEPVEVITNDEPAITADELLKKFRVFAGLNRPAAIALLAEFGAKTFNDPATGKPTIPEARWNEFVGRCNVPG